MSKTLIFIKEKGLDSYEELCEKTNAVCVEFHKWSDSVKDIETRMKAITELQKQIGTYGKTRDVYKQWLATGRDAAFYEANRADIALHQAAKKHFDSLGLKKKLPSINALKQEFATLAAEKKTLYAGRSYKDRRDEMTDYLTARENATRILYGTQTPPQKSRGRDAR